MLQGEGEREDHVCGGDGGEAQTRFRGVGEVGADVREVYEGHGEREKFEERVRRAGPAGAQWVVGTS